VVHQDKEVAQLRDQGPNENNKQQSKPTFCMLFLGIYLIEISSYSCFENVARTIPFKIVI
jgi:hypothetical protein